MSKRKPDDANDSAPLLTPEEAAEILRVHRTTLQRLRNKHGLPCVRVGHRIKFDRGDIERWLKARKVG